MKQQLKELYSDYLISSFNQVTATGLSLALKGNISHDQTKNRSVKGINLLNCVYQGGNVTLPVGFDLIKKPIEFCEIKTKKKKRKVALTLEDKKQGHVVRIDELEGQNRILN